MPRMRGTIAGIHSEYSEVIDTARAESFFRDVPMPISRQVPSPVGTRSCFASEKNHPTSSFIPWKSNCRSRQKSLALAHNNKSDGGQKKNGRAKSNLSKRICLHGRNLYLYISSWKKTEPSHMQKPTGCRQLIDRKSQRKQKLSSLCVFLKYLPSQLDTHIYSYYICTYTFMYSHIIT